MEIYAAFLEYADHHVGASIDALADLGIPGRRRSSTTSSATTARRRRVVIGAFNDKTGARRPT
jgi:hypothetical protein